MTYVPSGENSMSINESISNKSPNVLIMAVDSIVRDLIAHRVQLLGWETMNFSSHEELDLLLAASLPQLFIVDLDETGSLGLNLVERLSTVERTSQIPILCVSAEGDLSLAELAYRTGARDFLVIPFDMLALQQKVETAIQKQLEKLEKKKAEPQPHLVED